MNIETYGWIMCIIFTGLFAVSVLAGIIALGYNIVKRKPLKYGWIIPCVIVYSVFALFNTFVPSIAYDDISHPNYSRYEGWSLPDFILNDIKMLLLWVFIGIFLYFRFHKKETAGFQKAGGRTLFILGAVLFVLMIFLFVFTG